MARLKQRWNAAIQWISVRLTYQYEGNTLVSTEFKVYLTLALDREPDRNINVELTVSEAEKIIKQLTVAAARAEKLNSEWA